LQLPLLESIIMGRMLLQGKKADGEDCLQKLDVCDNIYKKRDNILQNRDL